MATAKKQLASTVAAGAKKPAARPAATPAPRPAPRPATNALSIDPRLMGRFAQPLGRLSAPLPGIGQMEALRRALNGVPQQPSMPYQGPRFPGVGLPGFGGDPRFPGIGIPQFPQRPGVGVPQFPQRPVFSDDYGRPPLVSVPQRPGGTFDPSLDPTIKAYLDRQRMLSATDAGVAYTFDPATQTFRGATMGGPVTMSLQDMQRAAAQDLARRNNIPQGFPGLTQVLQDPMEMQRKQAEQAAMFARDLQMGRTGGMTQEAFAAQQAAERQQYAQQLQAQEMARQAGMPDYVRPYLGGPTGLGSAGPMQPPAVGMFGDRGMPGFGGDPRFPGLGFDERRGLGQMPQISGRLPGGAYAQQGPTTQAQPRPAAPSNYGGFNSIQGMGANQYGGFTPPPMPQASTGQMPSQPQPTQNQGGGMFGSFGNAQPNQNQNQNPNQQAQTTGQAPTGGGLF